MRLSHSVRVLLVPVLLLSVLTGCRMWRGSENANANSIPAVRSVLPFSTKEPDVYTADIVVTVGDTQRTTRIAKRGTKYRYDHNAGRDNQLTTIENGSSLLISERLKIFAEVPDGSKTLLDTGVSDPASFAWLKAGPHADFELLETSNGIARYRVRPQGAESSEIYIYVDENIGMPVKQEFFSTIGDQSTLRFTMELREFRAEVDDSVFEVPPGFGRVTPEELRRRLREQ